MKPKRKQYHGPPGTKALAVVRRYFPKVDTVKDATKVAFVEVTSKDNTNSKVKDHQTCALALACVRFFKADGVIIGLTTSYIITGTLATRYKNADTVSREITSFDRKAGFDTGFYNLVPPSPASRLDAAKLRGDTHPKTGNPARHGFKHFTKNVRTTLGTYGIS